MKRKIYTLLAMLLVCSIVAMGQIKPIKKPDSSKLKTEKPVEKKQKKSSNSSSNNRPTATNKTAKPVKTTTSQSSSKTVIHNTIDYELIEFLDSVIVDLQTLKNQSSKKAKDDGIKSLRTKLSQKEIRNKLEKYGLDRNLKDVYYLLDEIAHKNDDKSKNYFDILIDKVERMKNNVIFKQGISRSSFDGNHIHDEH